MILTCHTCPKQLCFCGSNRSLFARMFGWVIKGQRFYCAACGEEVR